MYLLFDSAGKFAAGHILFETEGSAQVELDGGKRVKVKAQHQLLRFDAPAPAKLLAQAQASAAEVDPALAWEFAPDAEFGFEELATLYFGEQAGVIERAAALFALHGVPHYFRRAGGGRFRKAPAEILEKALAAIARKQQVEAQIGAWADQLVGGECPDRIGEELYRILFRPDKNAPEYKAVAQAARRSGQAPLALLTRAGAIRSAYEFHWQRFLFENFPDGTGFPRFAQAAVRLSELPLAPVQAFSVDDASTTEIDDALSLQGLGRGSVTLGIHIAAAGLAIQPDDALDQIARQRLSTVYMPGYKITMLPEPVIDQYTLIAGRATPAVSLYVTVDEATLEVQHAETHVERVHVLANLRHDELEFNPDHGLVGSGARAAEAAGVPGLPEQLGFLLRLAEHLKAGREQVRGKPETQLRPDYTISLVDAPNGPPTGSERVRITQRPRGAPLDLIVSELMILANSHWAGWLKSLGVPAIYRSQAALAPGVKVRMGTRALPHAGIGVASYCWSTSPLRRYADLVNQWQIIAAAQHGTTAALAAPFKPRDAALLGIVSAFESAYRAYHDHEAAMQRYWTLRYLQQEGIVQLTARLLREQGAGAWLARAENLPLVLSVIGMSPATTGSRVRVRLGEPDLVALDLHGSVTEVLATLQETASADEESDEDVGEAGAIAITMDEAEPEPAVENPPLA